jgi:hypothetical protein
MGRGRPASARCLCLHRIAPSVIRGMGHDFHETLELKWRGGHRLSSLRGRSNRLLPSNKSGVYRIFLPGTTIDRFCGKDPHLVCRFSRRSRYADTFDYKKEHHATKAWHYNDELRNKYRWDALAVGWAVTQVIHNANRKDVGPKQAESWLLKCYNDSFGEYPPLNQKAW